MQSTSEQKANIKPDPATAEIELYEQMKRVDRYMCKASDALDELSEEYSSLMGMIDNTCWDCGECNLEGKTVCIHCGQLLDYDDYKKTMEEQNRNGS